MDDPILNKIVNKLDNIERQVNTTAVEVVNNKERLDNMATRDGMNEKFDLVLSCVDRFVRLHETLDQELSALRNGAPRASQR